MDNLSEKLKHLPENPGVYVMLDKNGVIIYVGKAKNLKNRVRQYFFNSVKTQKVMAMVANVADFYYIIVPTEIDALSLENNLIKKHKPRYNILLNRHAKVQRGHNARKNPRRFAMRNEYLK